mgnify:CR=1 FL=1
MAFLSGSEATTINSTITELYPAIAFNNGKRFADINEFQKFVKVIDHKTKSYQFKDLDNQLCIQQEDGDRLFMSKCEDKPNNKWNTSNPEKVINGNNKCFNVDGTKLNVKTCGKQENVKNLEALCPDCNKHNDTVRLINNTYAYDSIPEKQVENITIDPFWKEYLEANKDKLGDLDVNMFGHKDNEWEYNGVKLCIGKGSPSEQCDNTKLFCAGGDTYGENDRVINAIVESAAFDKVERNCYFFYGARQQKDLYLTDEISAIEKKWAKGYKFKFIPVLSEEPEDSDWTGGRGFVTDFFKENYLKTGIVKADSCKAFFCGPPPMIDAGAKVLKEAGVSEDSMFFDKFEDARSPAPVIDNSKCVLCDECLLVKPTADCIVETAKLGDVKENGKFADIKRIDPAFTSGLYYNTLYINEDKCIRCYACVHACPHKAISPNYDLEPKTLRNIVEI